MRCIHKPGMLIVSAVLRRKGSAEMRRFMEKDEFLAALQKDKISEDVILLLKRETLPLVMWGCGDVGDSVFEYLCEHNIKLGGGIS